VFVVNFDEWGGFFEHVPPPRAQAPTAVDTDIVGGKTLLGFRLPVVIASPFSRGDAQNPRISSLVFDHTSVLKLIEWRWGLAPLTSRDASGDINNLAYALNFNQPQTAVPTLPKPNTPAIATPCLANVAVSSARPAESGTGPSSSSTTEKWKELQNQAERYGFKVE
jgi:phospholipase C